MSSWQHRPQMVKQGASKHHFHRTLVVPILLNIAYTSRDLRIMCGACEPEGPWVPCRESNAVVLG